MQTPPYVCKFCGMPSWLDPYDQSAPPDYCHESDHGEPNLDLNQDQPNDNPEDTQND